MLPLPRKPTSTSSTFPPLSSLPSSHTPIGIPQQQNPPTCPPPPHSFPCSPPFNPYPSSPIIMHALLIPPWPPDHTLYNRCYSSALVGGVGWGSYLGFGKVGGRKVGRKGGGGEGDVRGEEATRQVCVCVCVCEWKRVVCCGMRLSLGFCDSSLFLMICFFFTAFLIAFYFFFPPCFPLFFWLAVSQNLFTLLPIFFSNLLPYSSHPRPSPPQPTAPTNTSTSKTPSQSAVIH